MEVHNGADIAARRRPVAPDKAQQLLAAVNLARIAHQELQKVKFLRRKVLFLSVYIDTAGGLIDL